MLSKPIPKGRNGPTPRSTTVTTVLNPPRVKTKSILWERAPQKGRIGQIAEVSLFRSSPKLPSDWVGHKLTARIASVGDCW